MISGKLKENSQRLVASTNAHKAYAHVGNNEYTIVFYGYLVDSAELKAKYDATNDAQTVLRHFIKKGVKAFDDFAGSYSFAIFDHNEKKLILTRDKIGTKNIFYFQEKDSFVFASTLRQLFCDYNVKAVLDSQSIKHIALLGPARPQNSGIYKGVNTVKAGHYVVWQNNTINTIRYYSLQSKEWTMNIDDSVDYAKKLITNRTQSYLDTNSPVACFLSGGIDSSILSSIAKDYYAKKALVTISVDYQDNKKDFVPNSFQPNSDGPFIATMSEFLHSVHTNIVLDNNTLAKAIDDAAIYRGLPGMADVDSSLLLLCSRVKQEYNIAMSGECADEIFGGYPWYHDKDLRDFEGFVWSRNQALRTSLFDIDTFAAKNFVEDYYQQSILDVEYLESDGDLDRQIRKLFVLHMNWFGASLLERKEMMSGASGLQVQLPYADHKVVEFAYNLPWNIKSLNGREKGILRQAFKGILPESIIERKKSPYPKSFSPIYFETVKERTRDILASNSQASSLINKNAIQKLLDSDANAIEPWFGQLMRVPQLLGYIIQLDTVLKEFNVKIVD